ncbi:MAG: hypothetical protein U5K27_17210 [Desulfotignum sp.]|nr:hypothetical protein [Desulfotignum sp.]
MPKYSVRPEMCQPESHPGLNRSSPIRESSFPKDPAGFFVVLVLIDLFKRMRNRQA